MESLALNAGILQEAIVHTLIDSLWQGALVVIVVWSMKQFFKPGPQIQYFISLMGLLSIVVMCCANFASYSISSQDITLPFVSSIIMKLDQPTIFWLFSLWVLGTLFFFIRFILSHLFLKKIIRNAQCVQEKEWLSNFNRIKDHFNLGKNILLMHSDRISSAFLTGVLKPIVIIPTAWVNGLQTKEIECILAHEFSHIRSKDHWINLFVQLAEMIFYFNPAVHILINHIKLDRELQADLSANSYVQSPIVYAKLILKVEEQTGMIPLFSIPFFKQRNQLRRRIESVLNISKQNNYKENALSLYVALSCLLFLGLEQNREIQKSMKFELTPLYSISFNKIESIKANNCITIDNGSEFSSKRIIKESKGFVNKKSIPVFEKQKENSQNDAVVSIEPSPANETAHEIQTIEGNKEATKEIIFYSQSDIKLDSLATIDGDGAWIISKQGKSFQPKTTKAIIILKSEATRILQTEINTPDAVQTNERGSQSN